MVPEIAQTGQQVQSASFPAFAFRSLRLLSSTCFGELRELKPSVETAILWCARCRTRANAIDHKLDSRISNTQDFHGNSIQAAVCLARLLLVRTATGPQSTYKHGVSL